MWQTKLGEVDIVENGNRKKGNCGKWKSKKEESVENGNLWKLVEIGKTNKNCGNRKLVGGGINHGKWNFWKKEIVESRICVNGNCGKWILWKVEIVEIKNWGKYNLWKMAIAEKGNCGNCGNANINSHFKVQANCYLGPDEQKTWRYLAYQQPSHL